MAKIITTKSKKNGKITIATEVTSADIDLPGYEKDDVLIVIPDGNVLRVLEIRTGNDT